VQEGGDAFALEIRETQSGLIASNRNNKAMIEQNTDTSTVWVYSVRGSTDGKPNEAWVYVKKSDVKAQRFRLPLAIEGRTAGEQAVAAAEEWLILIDQERYDEAWTTLSPAKSASMDTKEKLLDLLKTERAPLGFARSRMPRAVAALHDAESGAPTAFRIEFNTSLGSRREGRPGQELIETVAVTRAGDGRWRVSSYEIRQGE